MTTFRGSRSHHKVLPVRAAQSRGIALVTTLLLLSLMVAMMLAMVIAVSSDSLITRYYRNFRSSFYAADSGLNIARQYMIDQLVAAAPTGSFAANVQPIPTGTESTVQGNVTTQYGPNAAASNRTINLGQGASSGVTYPNPDTLIPGNNNGQVFGIFTTTGDVQMNNLQSNGKIELDASIAMISQGGTGGWINTGNSINTITLVGGRIANMPKACNCTSRNLYFDQRFASNGFAPPWFPSTTITPSSSDSVQSVTPTTQRTGWVVANY